MAKRKRSSSTKVAEKPKDESHSEIEWVQIWVPRDTGPISTLALAAQTKFYTREQQENWTRLHSALHKLSEQEANGRQFGVRAQHDNAKSLRWLIDALQGNEAPAKQA